MPSKDVNEARDLAEKFMLYREAVMVLRHYGLPEDPVELDKELMKLDRLRVAAKEYCKEYR